MSLYSAIFGLNDRAGVLLACLGLSTSDVPRFRDCYLRDNAIVVYTRTGGGNREYYEKVANGSEPRNPDLRKNPYYITDMDCDFDSTYAYFIFKYPPEYAELLTKIHNYDGPNIEPNERWRQLFDDLRTHI